MVFYIICGIYDHVFIFPRRNFLFNVVEYISRSLLIDNKLLCMSDHDVLLINIYIYIYIYLYKLWSYLYSWFHIFIDSIIDKFILSSGWMIHYYRYLQKKFTRLQPQKEKVHYVLNGEKPQITLRKLHKIYNRGCKCTSFIHESLNHISYYYTFTWN